MIPTASIMASPVASQSLYLTEQYSAIHNLMYSRKNEQGQKSNSNLKQRFISIAHLKIPSYQSHQHNHSIAAIALHQS